MSSRSHTIPLRLGEMKQLHTDICEKWWDWVENAPDHWKSDGFLNRIPISVACRYGQDQPLDITTHKQQLMQEFSANIQARRLRFFSFALATHIEYVFQPIILQSL